jgi:salicylate hydroxylase
MSASLQIALIGAGIGGMAAAVALRRLGIPVTVFEQAPELGEVGAGLTITPNATRALAGLELEDEMAALAEATPHVGTLHWRTGERLGYTPRGAAEYLKRYGAITRHVHRADLHDVLVRAFAPTPETLRLDHRLVRIAQSADAVTVVFANGVEERFDVVVGCDGLKSVVRDQLFPTEPPVFTGYVSWRGLAERSRVPHVNLDPHFASYAGNNKMFGRYPVRHGTLINYVGMAKRTDIDEESWTAKADVEEVLAEFKDWHSDVVDIIKATPKDGCFRWALHSRKPLDSWIAGRVTLLGDAAHPTTPFLGMGAAMGIEDGVIFARCIQACGDDWAAALARYEKARLERGNGVHADSWSRGAKIFGTKPEERNEPPGVGLGELYRYDAMTVPV